MDNEQKGLLEDVILEMMEFNQNIVQVDSRISMSNDYLNNIDANSFVMNDQLQNIADILGGNNLAALEKAKEDGVLQERTLNALNAIADNTTPKKTVSESSAGGFGGIILGAISFVAGFISGYLKQFVTIAKSFFIIVKEAALLIGKGIAATFRFLKAEFGATKIGAKIMSLVSSVGNFFTGVLDRIKLFFKESSFVKKIKSIFTSVKNFFLIPLNNVKAEFKLFSDAFGNIVPKVKALLGPIFGIGDRLNDVKGVFTSIKNTVGGWVSNVLSKIKGVLKIFTAGGVLGKFGAFFGKIFAPFTIIMALFDTVSGAMKGYEDGGILGAIKGGLGGLISSIIGTPLNMLKDLASWIASKLGFESFSETLDSFDFLSLIKNGIDGIFNWFSTLFTDPGAALTELWNNLVGKGGYMDLLFKPIDMLIDWITKTLGFRDEDAPEFSIGNILRGVWNTIIEWVASLIEKIPLVGNKGASMIRGLAAGEATVDIKKMSAPPIKEVQKSGDTLNKSDTERRNSETATEMVKDSAALSVPASVSSNSGSSPVTNSQNTYNISNPNIPDRSFGGLVGNDMMIAA